MFLLPRVSKAEWHIWLILFVSDNHCGLPLCPQLKRDFVMGQRLVFQTDGYAWRSRGDMNILSFCVQVLASQSKTKVYFINKTETRVLRTKETYFFHFLCVKPARFNHLPSTFYATLSHKYLIVQHMSLSRLTSVDIHTLWHSYCRPVPQVNYILLWLHVSVGACINMIV